MKNEMKGSNDSIGVNYLELCDATVGKEAKDAQNVAAGIRSVIKGETKEFLYDYPCHGPDGRHFFYLRSIRVAEKEPIRVVVSHEDITALILAEEALRQRERERDRLRHSLELAKEIQQILLPKDNPKIKGLEVAGKSVYCDETGGDYYDFLKLKENGNEKIGVILGDISGHGIPSALLMATARAFIRQRSFLPGSLTEIITDINVLLCADAMESNSFMTLFYAMIDTYTNSIKWIRAGHDPAIVYDPKSDNFEELVGPAGIPIGVVPDWHYEEDEKTGLEKDQVIVISTDGINETLNPQNKMYGKEPVLNIIRKNKNGTAEQILKAIIADLNRFRKGRDFQDDVTLIVIKIME